MYCMEIRNENNDSLVVLHFLHLIKAYDFVKKLNCRSWAWNNEWRYINVYRITTNECGNEGLVEEPMQFTISREAFEELKH